MTARSASCRDAVMIAPDSLARRLKRETGPAHDRVEAAFDLPAATARRETYVEALQKLLVAHLAIRSGLARVAGARAAVAGREADRRVEWLCADLAVLDETRPANALAFRIGDDDEALGCEYVLRGAALGGLVIARLARDRLGLTERSGASFFHGDGARTKGAWSDFQQILSLAGTHGAAADRTLRGANSTFHLVTVALSTPIVTLAGNAAVARQCARTAD